MIEYTLITYATATLGAFGAGVLSSAIGIGGGIVLVAFLTLVLSAREAIVLSAPVLLIGMLARAYSMRSHVHWRLTCAFLIGGVPGAMVGAWVLAWVDKTVLSIVLAVALVVSLVVSRSKLSSSLTLRNRGFVGLGFGTGVMSAAVGGTGPLASPFFLARGLYGPVFVATMAAGYAGISGVRMTAYFMAGVLTPGLLLVAALAVASILIGNVVGARLSAKLRPALFRSAVELVVVVAAGRLLVDVLRG